MKRLYEPMAYDTEAPIGSWWEDSGVEPLDFPAAKGDITTEVAIIGGGYTGLNAALQLREEHGLECVLLEAAQPGWGASGRNGGFACLGGAVMSTKTQIKRFGLDATKAHMAAQMASIERVADNLVRYNIDADTHSKGELLLAHRPDKYAGMQHEARFYRDTFGIGFSEIPKDQLAAHGASGPEFHGGIISKAGFALNPLKYSLGLARAAQKAGARLFGGSTVTAIAKEGAGFILTTGTATIRAKKLIIATNGYSADDLPNALGGRFLPLLSTIMVTRPITEDEQTAQGWATDLMAYDSRHLLHYFRLMPDGRFLFGQRGAVTATPAATKAAQQTSRRDFERMFPAWRHIKTDYNWAGLLCLTRNLHQFAGPIPTLQGAFAALGYHGNGVAMASYAGRAVADIAMGKPVDLPPIMARPLNRFPLPALRRWAIRGAYVKYQLQDRFF
ncbi:MAG: FAD-binding oxidoreductase [Alphaproteobacteria bacterium]|nr:FAD-binding oxidoreductase [Alphaproteobacteria bacterium]